MQETFYIYQHIRLDNNNPMYIGIGTKDCRATKEDRKYARAYRISGRNKIWNDIFAITKFRVEILLESTKREEVLECEGNLIEKIGRICNGTGPLANICVHGVSSLCEIKFLKNKKELYIYDESGVFINKFRSINAACRLLSLSDTCITDVLQGKRKSTKGLRIFETFQGENIGPLIYVNPACKKIQAFDKKGNLFKVFDSIKDAALELKTSAKNISNCCSLKWGVAHQRQTCSGFYWRFYSEEKFVIPEFRGTKPIPVQAIHVTTREILNFSCIGEAYRFVGGHETPIRNRCLGKHKTVTPYMGYFWKLTSDETFILPMEFK